VAALGLQEKLKEKWLKMGAFRGEVHVYPTISQAIDYVRLLGEGDDGEGQKVSALITGSVRLVGAALSVLDDSDAL
jgi:folylpolyglutamate synthase